MYSCHLFLISLASVRSIPFLSFIEPTFSWNVPLVSLIFLRDLWSFPFYYFPLFALFTLESFVISPCSSLELSAFRWVYLPFSPLSFTSVLFSAICKASLGNRFTFLHFFFLGMVLITASCTMLGTFVHRSSGTLSDLIPWIYLSFPLFNFKGLDLHHTWWSSGFPYFLQFKSEFCNKEFMIWATISSLSRFS